MVCIFGLLVFCKQLHNFLSFWILKTTIVVLLILLSTFKLLVLVLILSEDLL